MVSSSWKQLQIIASIILLSHLHLYYQTIVMLLWLRKNCICLFVHFYVLWFVCIYNKRKCTKTNIVYDNILDIGFLSFKCRNYYKIFKKHWAIGYSWIFWPEKYVNVICFMLACLEPIKLFLRKLYFGLKFHSFQKLGIT